MRTFLQGLMILCLGWVAVAAEAPAVFVHPGLLHTRADLERMKQKVAQGTEPWKSGFEVLRKDFQSQANWRLRGPFTVVTRDPHGSTRIAEFDQDGNAAYQNALLWCLTGNEAHAKKAAEILNAWSGALTEINGKDKILGASLGGFKYVNAAELLRHTWRGWPPTDAARCEQMLQRVIRPIIADCAPFANGNWDTGCLKTLFAIAVFCNDRTLWQRTMDYYLGGAGNGRLTHYIINPEGQCQESGRDQGHTQLGLAHLAEACEIAWNQGADLYGAADHRLLRGFEYTAKYNLGQEVPFTPGKDTTGKYKAKKISAERRGELRPIYEMVWNHYEQRRHLLAPFTKQAAEKIRPEGPASGADHPGFGTLLFTR
ncbi:MAG: alginate lyase family protein [Kiritimatiellaeota bacterium]|nr:alginate lyase family protein [Kiritimatiellota bacterium]